MGATMGGTEMPPTPDDHVKAREQILADLGRLAVPDAQALDAEIERRGYDPEVVARGLKAGYAPGVIAGALEPEPPEPVTVEVRGKPTRAPTMRELAAELRERGWVEFYSYCSPSGRRWMRRETAERLVALGGGHIVEPRRTL
jgi:hypothetical protein